MTPLVTLGLIENLASPGDLLLLAIIALLFFGRRLPDMGKNLGKTIVEFKKGLNGATQDDQEEVVEEEQPRPVTRKPATRITASNPRPKSAPTTEEV